MLRDFRQFTPRIFLTVALAAAVALGAIVAIPQWLSKQARLEVQRSHVARTAQLAASVVDGDLHRRLLDPENYTAELYERTLAPLVRFHSAAPDIFYVYTMVERDGRSYFVTDTAASEQIRDRVRHALLKSAYMQPFEEIAPSADPDWLKRIAAGETYVYPIFQRDEYGTFLSGHTPIYDSKGRYSGFVGVDFDLDGYLQQEATFQSIYIGTLIAALLIALLIGYLVARYDYHVVRRIEEQYNISVRDELTGLLNRRGALGAVRAALAMNASTYAAILVDVDDLKGVNDTHGHAVGDSFLLQVADAMRASVREHDVCARLGGDEFLIFAAGCDLDAATEISRRILGHVYSDDAAPSRSHFGVSIGVYIAAGRDADFESMYRRADQALYRAKAAGRNRFVVFDPISA